MPHELQVLLSYLRKEPCKIIHYFRSQTGFQQEVNQQLQKEANLEALPECRRFCSLVVDEMKVKENLVYDKYTGEIVGFISLGDINDQLLELE